MMNTVRKSENLLPFPVISAAANGDTNAMCAILKHYEGYIAKLCTRTLKDDAGNTYSYVDEEMRNRLQVRLITRTLAFHTIGRKPRCEVGILIFGQPGFHNAAAVGRVVFLSHGVTSFLARKGA